MSAGREPSSHEGGAPDATDIRPGLAGGGRRLRRVKPFPPRDQVTATAWAVVAVLSALREQGKAVYEVRRAFNRTCDEALADLQQQIAALGFPTAH